MQLVNAIKPRKYQQDAFEAVKTYLEYRDGNPCVVFPTGGGKTILICLLCDWVTSWGGRVLILAHVKELLEQAADKLNSMCPQLHVGIYSAGLNSRETMAHVTVAGIQSIYGKAADFEPFDLIICDECHLIPPSGDGMYRTFIEAEKKLNSNVKIVGLTATPYRTSTGLLCGPTEILNAICYEVGVLDLIKQGYLSKLVSKHVSDCDTSSLHVRAGEFIASEIEALMGDDNTVAEAVANILNRTQDRKSVLLFCAGIMHSEKICKSISELGHSAATIDGETPSNERKNILERFKSGEIKYLCNVSVLTTGFDAPNIDCVVLLRPTLSPGLYAQMVGRGFRLSPGKEDCLVLDFAGNVMRHGPINAVRAKKNPGGGSKTEVVVNEYKVCPECESVVLKKGLSCFACNYEFPIEIKHNKQAGTKEIIDELGDCDELPVYRVKFAKHFKRNGTPDNPPTMRVEYETTRGGSLVNSFNNDSVVKEWVCIEHPEGFALRKARQWWSERSNDPFPPTIDRAIDIAEGGGIAATLKIWTRPNKDNAKFTDIVKHELGPKPEAIPPCECGGEGCEKCEFEFPADETRDAFDDVELPF